MTLFSVSATFDGAVFHIGATMAGPIDTSPTAGLLYVFGVNKGGATSPGPFANVGNPNVIFKYGAHPDGHRRPWRRGKRRVGK